MKGDKMKKNLLSKKRAAPNWDEILPNDRD